MGGGDSKAPNQVDIMQDGGCCAGGEGCGYCVTPRFEDNYMDPRLQPYLTEQEFKKVVGEMNQTLRTKLPSGKIWLLGIPCLVIGGLFLSFIRPEAHKCEAANGECWPGQDPAADQCCRYNCCPTSGPARRLLEDRELDNELNATSAAWDFLAPSSGVSVPDDDSARSLLSSRRMQESFACFVADAQEGAECKCRTVKASKGQKTICDGRINIDGAYSITPPTIWPIFVAVPLFCVFCAVLAYAIVVGCQLRGHLDPLLLPWRQKGLRAEYRPGRKHFQARISVWPPVGAPAMLVGSAVRQMQVQVPPGAVAGTTLQFTAPNGQTVQAIVPAGVGPGGAFTISY